MTCSVKGCSKPHHGRSWCAVHYRRWYSHGDPLAGRTTYPDIASRFWAKVDKKGAVSTGSKSMSTCWTWTAAKNHDGYGQFRHDGTMRSAHRIAFLLTHGAEPKGMSIDHICRNRSCVRPAHFRLVTVKQNLEHVALHAKSTSGFRGVHFKKREKKWQVLVRHNGVGYSGGYFADVNEANAAAIALRNRLFTHNDLDRRSA